MTKPITTTLPNILYKSPLNYIGGKYKILPQILPLFPKDSDIFLDLFCGGCNVAINANAKQIICNDNLIYLIELYEFLQQNNIDSVLNNVSNIIEKYQLNLENKDAYNALRDEYNKKKSPLFLLVLIAFSFNHQIRFNNAHKFNNPFGRNRSSFNPAMKQHLMSFINILQEKYIRFYKLDFKDMLSRLNLTPQSFVYADPPYLITQGVYNDGKRGFSGWNEKLENTLLQSLNELNEKGVKFALSNVLEHKGMQNKILKEWINAHNYRVFTISRDYTNANYQAKFKDKTTTKEVLITNYEPYCATSATNIHNLTQER